MPLHRHLAVTGAWWDHVDVLATHHVARILVGHPDRIDGLMRARAVEDDLWLRRTAIRCRLHRRAGTDLDLLRHVLVANLDGTRGALHTREAQ